MKFNKLYTLLLASVMFVGCSDDDESWNNSKATVSMGETELSYKENKGIVNIPIVVDGTLNGPIQVTVEVAEKGSNPAMDDIHYLVTSKTIVIPEDATSGSIEMITVDDDEINEAREFTMSIKSAVGATIGSSASATITLKDNDSAFYEKLQGKWKMSSLSSAGAASQWDVTIVGAEEGEEDYDKVLYITGIMGYSWTSMRLEYEFDPATKQGRLFIPFGYVFAEGVNFSGLGVCDVATGGVDNGYISFAGGVEGFWNDDFTEVKFEENKLMYGFLVQDGAPNGYTWFNCMNIVLTK